MLAGMRRKGKGLQMTDDDKQRSRRAKREGYLLAAKEQNEKDTFSPR